MQPVPRAQPSPHPPHPHSRLANGGSPRYASVEANIMGSGDVNVRSVTGKVEKSVMGSGSINVGG